ncbi:MAG: ABC transporter permease [Acidobacteria bacterium]|nr:ABC transporter permease [Acidobacteriota bacterium]
MTGSLWSFLARRTLAAVVLVLVVSTSAYVIARVAPGDETTADELAGVDPQTIAIKRARLGLDDPLPLQVGRWFAGMMRFDLGESSYYQRPVSALVVERGLNTAQLAAVALVLATLLGVPLGVWTGAYPRHVLSRVVVPVSLALVACPPLVAALGLMLFAVSTGALSIVPGAVVLPAIALGLPVAAMLERLQSQATHEAMQAPDLVAAAARGIPPSRLVWRHAARQSLRPVLGVYGIIVGSLFSGSLAVELVTSWPGLGRLLYDAVLASDVALVAGCAVAGAVCLAIGNLLTDVLRVVVDPRAAESA